MKMRKYVLPLLAATCSVSAFLHAEVFDQNDYSSTIEERETDIRALRDYEATKGAVSLRDKSASIMLSGDVRFEYYNAHAKWAKHKQRGSGSGSRRFPDQPRDFKHVPFPTNIFDIEVNLMLDYKADSTWASLHCEFDNPAGIRERPENLSKVEFIKKHKNLMFGSGRLSNIAFRKAFMGMNVMDSNYGRFDVELGRRRLYETFDSKIEFQNIYDGLTLKYKTDYTGVMGVSAQAAAFVVDQTVNHFAWIGELGLLNLAERGLDFKYSYIHWDRAGHNRWDKRHPYGVRFNVSQFLLNYSISQDLIKQPSQLYGAYLHNHAADGNHYSHHKKEDNAWYAGVRMGQIRGKSDWAWDFSYQWVQAQSIPESDVRGIGRDNPRAISFYRRSDGGFANYKGWRLTGIYAITDNLTVNAGYEKVRQCSREIGGKYHSHQFNLETIYAF